MGVSPGKIILVSPFNIHMLNPCIHYVYAVYRAVYSSIRNNLFLKFLVSASVTTCIQRGIWRGGARVEHFQLATVG